MPNNKDNKKQEAPKKEATAKKAEKKPKVDFKKKYEEADKQLKLQESKILALELEKKNLELQFQEKSKGFASKAKDEISALKKELSDKSAKDLANAIKYAPQKFIDSIYEPLINLEIAVESGASQGPDVQAYVMGFKMLLGQMFDSFTSFGIQFIEPKQGDEYDPVIHDVFGKESGDKDKILKVKKKGIKLHDRVVKPALVVIGE